MVGEGYNKRNIPINLIEDIFNQAFEFDSENRLHALLCYYGSAFVTRLNVTELF